LEHSNELGELSKALSLAQAELKGAEKTATNPFFHSSYATLKDVWEAVRVPLSKHGLSIIQTTDPADSGVIVNTMLCHSSGQWVKGKLFMRPAKSDPQAIGSAITYARRYALAAMVGVYQEDDDGNTASQPKARIEIKPQPQQHPAPYIAPSIAHHADVDMSHNFDDSSMQEKTCELCHSELKTTKNGNALYCPNFKDKSGGEHTYIRM